MMLGHSFLLLEAGGKRTSLSMSEHAFSTSEVLSIGRGENNIICAPQLKLAFEQNGKCSLGKIGTVSKVFQVGCVVASLGNVALKTVPSYRPAIAIRPTGNCHSVTLVGIRYNFPRLPLFRLMAVFTKCMSLYKMVMVCCLWRTNRERILWAYIVKSKWFEKRTFLKRIIFAV